MMAETRPWTSDLQIESLTRQPPLQASCLYIVSCFIHARNNYVTVEIQLNAIFFCAEVE